jgi:hypothetical protein
MNRAPQRLTIEDQYPIADGFLLSTSLKCDLQFTPLAIQEFQALRRAGCMRTKVWCVPTDVNSIPIPAFDSYEIQLYCKPGSAIWGYSLIGPWGGPNGIISFLVRDACDDVALVSESLSRQPVTGPAPQQPLARILVVPPPGVLNIVIASTFTTPQQAQLILWGGEPA